MPGRSLSRKFRVPIVVVLSAALVLLTTAERCPNRARARAVNNLKELLNTPAWGSIDVDETLGLRVHIYPAPPERLRQGTVVEAYEPIQAESSTQLTCEGQAGCWLVFVDTDHYAHFAHKVVVALWEFESKEFKGPIVASWWPLVDGQPVFNTVESREVLFLEQITTPVPEVDPATRWGLAQWRYDSRSAPPPTPTPANPMDPPPTATPVGSADCPVWAVIVNGYDDESDTFDEDADGMYSILNAHGVPPEHIYYLSPLLASPPCDTPTVPPMCPTATVADACLPAASSPGCPQADDYLQAASYCNLQRVLKEYVPAKLEASGGKCDEFVFFISTHGGIDTLHCGPDLLCHVDLKNLLANIKCDKLTVIVEACFSGGLLDHVADPPTSIPSQKRLVFTSTTKFGVSHQDIDLLPASGWIPDTNPGDSGSETIWGYIESFGSGITDGAPDDNRISFAEAIGFAIDHDVMYVNNKNTPQVTPTPAPGLIAHSCLAAPGSVDIEIEIKPALLQQASATVGAVLADAIIPGEKLILPVLISNVTSAAGSGVMTVATVKLYWAPNDNPEWPTDFFDYDAASYFDRQIGDTALVTAIPAGSSEMLELEWNVDEGFDGYNEIMFVVMVDSPQDPFASTPQKVVDLVSQTNNVSYLIMDVVQSINTGGCPLGCRTLR